MKITTIIDPHREEEIIIYTHKNSKLTEQIKTLVSENGVDLIGYSENEAVKLDVSKIPVLVAAHPGSVKFVADTKAPYFIYFLKKNSRENNKI